MPIDYPKTYQDIFNYVVENKVSNLFDLRKRTFLEIEKVTKNPLICYVSRTSGIQQGTPLSIDDDDIIGFSDLIESTPSDNADVFLVSNGGSPISAERIVKQLRCKYKRIRFFIVGNAYSAATMMCFSANEIIMHNQGTLGPIDPQINGIPAYSILRSFEEVEERLKKEGPSSLTAYMPLIAKYDLHLFNMCKNAQKLSEELAEFYLKEYMFGEKEKTNEEIKEIVRFFMNYEIHKSHGRSIDRNIAKEKGLLVKNSEEIPDLDVLLLSLFNQYQYFFSQSPFYKLFENARGINWGRSLQPPIPLPVNNQQVIQLI